MRLTVLGLQGSGKTWLTKKRFIPAYHLHCVVWDPNDEYTGIAGLIRYVPKFTGEEEKLREELRLFIHRVVLPNCWSLEQLEKTGKEKTNRLRSIIFDEADLIAPSKRNLNSALHDLIVRSRHLRVDLIFISRRPTDLSAYVMDVSDYLVIFKQVGYNALKTVRALKVDSEKEIKELDYKKHEFLLYDRERNYKKFTADTLELSEIGL